MRPKTQAPPTAAPTAPNPGPADIVIHPLVLPERGGLGWIVVNDGRPVFEDPNFTLAWMKARSIAAVKQVQCFVQEADGTWRWLD